VAIPQQVVNWKPEVCGNLKWQHPSLLWDGTMSPCTIDGAGNHLSFSDLLVYYPSLCLGIGFLRLFRGVAHVRLGHPQKGKRTFGNREKQFPSREMLQAADIVPPVAPLPQAGLSMVLLKNPVT